jgi:glycosyltransferase involved in cell wall biosynthesis
MIQLSAVIITFNEEQRIADCIRSLSDIADEVLVLDSNSTDRTAEICRELGVLLYSKPFEGYSIAKNYANQLAKYDFIISLDADEIISSALREQIIQFKSKASQFDAASFNRLTNYCGKWIHHGGWYPDVKLRIFNRKWAKWEGVVHETLKLDSRVKIIHLRGDLMHYSFHTPEEHRRKIEKYTTLFAQEAKLKKSKYSLLKMIFGPVYKFIFMYFIKLGILDGWTGLQIARLSAYSSFLKQKKLKQLTQK